MPDLWEAYLYQKSHSNRSSKPHIEKFNLEEKLEEISEREGRRLLEVEEMREKLN
jgi:hypothetical protein